MSTQPNVQEKPGITAPLSMVGANTRFLTFPKRAIHGNAQQRIDASFPRIFLKQGITELGFLIRKKNTFRTRRNQEACLAYTTMGTNEFERINARQEWANWRTIPKILSGYLPDRPLRALDLCCGTGQSTEVLSHYLPYGSRILGIEFNPNFVERANAKTYYHHSGNAALVSFRAQSVLDPLCDEQGELIPSGTVDLVNSSGAVGCHFDAEATRTLAAEVARVLRPGGLATIDSGLPGTKKSRLIDIFTSEGFECSHTAKSCFLDPYTQVCFRKV